MGSPESFGKVTADLLAAVRLCTASRLSVAPLLGLAWYGIASGEVYPGSSQLGQLIGMDTGNIRRSLLKYETLGIVKVRREGQRKFYSLNPCHHDTPTRVTMTRNPCHHDTQTDQEQIIEQKKEQEMPKPRKKPIAWKGCTPGLQASIIANYCNALEECGDLNPPTMLAVGTTQGLGLRWQVWDKAKVADRLIEEDTWKQAVTKASPGGPRWAWKNLLSALDEIYGENIHRSRAAADSRSKETVSEAANARADLESRAAAGDDEALKQLFGEL